MATLSVHLDDKAENILNDILQQIGLSISDIIKQGLIFFQEKTHSEKNQKPANFFSNYYFCEGDNMGRMGNFQDNYLGF